MQALSLVHDAGSTTARTAGSAIGVMPDGDVGFLSRSGVSSSRSTLALRAAPPQRQATDGLIGLAALFLICGIAIGSYFDAAVVGVGAGVVLAGAAWYAKVSGPDTYNRDVYPGLVERWRRTFMCGGCGDFFEVDRAALRAR